MIIYDGGFYLPKLGPKRIERIFKIRKYESWLSKSSYHREECSDTDSDREWERTLEKTTD